MGVRLPASAGLCCRRVARIIMRFRRVTQRLSDESGIVLLLALGFLVVLTISVATVITFTSASARDASRSSVGQNAYALAEAGINNALSVLATSGNDTTKVKPQPQYAGDPNSTILTLEGGTATWGGSYDPSARTWTIKSIGSIGNPTGASNVTRTLTETVQELTPPPYSFASVNSACEQHALMVKSSGQLTVTNAMYINSCNSPQDAFDIFGTGGNISAPAISVVGGWETHSGDTVTVNGTTCPLSKSVAPLTAAQPAGCPKTGQPVLADPFAGQIPAPALGAPACTYPVYGNPTSYNPQQKLAANITTTQTTITILATTPQRIQTGDVVAIQNEDLLVTGGGGTTTLTVQRAYNGTTAATHSNNTELKNVPVTGTAGTAASPAGCDVSSGTVTLQPGTYYGGICIGAGSGKDCGTKIGGSCTTTGSSPNVTLAAGTYIMAGGGFFVCGAATLSAPNVTIYNTQDPSNTAGSGAIDQVELNTTGSVTLGPSTTGPYQGMTIFQDPGLTVKADSCNNKSSHTNEWDIGLVSMASTGANGALGSISGTIYAPYYQAEFADSVSGIANLAVISSCILIDGGNSTFNFQPSGLFGLGWTLQQSG